MTILEESLLPPEATINQALSTLETAASKIVVVVDRDRHLLGTVTDGDIRRAILRGVALDQAVERIMNRQPVTAAAGEDSQHLMDLMRRGGYKQIPLLDGEGRVVGLESLGQLLEVPQRNNRVVLMAGGFGRRLRPLTEDAAKPMLTIGDKPILETIIENFIQHGFQRFTITLHYRAEDIIAHFGDGSRFGIEIEYLTEEEPLGTAGALRLLPERPSEALIVMNGDILTKVNFSQLLDFHEEHQARATICVRDYDYRVPYGVVRVEDHRFVAITEKPVQKFFVNAGIYALEPGALDVLPRSGAVDMPELFEALEAADQAITVFPIREYWLDIGQQDDLDQARSDFTQFFENSDA